jgi:hypothetical protein
MRRFYNVSRQKQKELEKLFPHTSGMSENDETYGFKVCSISIFDHWLTDDDACAELNDVSVLLAQERDDKLHKFCNMLTAETEAFLIKHKGRYKSKSIFKTFSSKLGRELSLNPLHFMRFNQSRFTLALPLMNILYFESWDFTHHLWYKSSEDLVLIKKIAKASGVYVLYKFVNKDKF